jgi:hypothetical protein
VLFAQNTLPPSKQAIENQYAQERAAGTQNPAPRNPNAPYPIVPSRPLVTGIFSDCDSFHSAIIVNCWVGLVNGQEMVVSAGVQPEFLDPQQGVVCVLADCVPTPVKAGAVRILAAQNGVFTIGSLNGSYTVTFNISTGAFASPTTTTAAATGGQYSDVATLRAAISPASVNGTVQFLVNGASIPGTATYDSSTGTATQPYTISLGQGSYSLQANFVSSNPLFSDSTGSNILAVTRENASVTPSANNPLAVQVSAPGGNATLIMLAAAIQEIADGSLGDISKATPVTFTLIPVVAAPSITCPVSTSVAAGALTAIATCTNVPVNVYDVSIVIGGNYYTGSADSVLAVYDPSLGFVTGGGIILHNGVLANFGMNSKYLKNGQIQGGLLYIEHRASGDVMLKSNALTALSIVGNTAVLVSKATLGGVGNYSFQATVIDNGEPGTNDQFGLQVTGPGGAQVSDLTFTPITLTGGNIQVPHN